MNESNSQQFLDIDPLSATWTYVKEPESEEAGKAWRFWEALRTFCEPWVFFQSEEDRRRFEPVLALATTLRPGLRTKISPVIPPGGMYLIDVGRMNDCLAPLGSLLERS